MIKTFADTDTEKLYRGKNVRRWGQDIQRGAVRKLIALNDAKNILDMSIPPHNRLKKLEGKGEFWSVRVNDQWRITFQWKAGDAFEVSLVDYH